MRPRLLLTGQAVIAQILRRKENDDGELAPLINPNQTSLDVIKDSGVPPRLFTTQTARQAKG
jgi:hypothetical protein